MADLFDSKSSGNPYEKLCYVYILYFDEAKGHLPILIYPDEELKNDKKFMRPIKYHSIWFLDIEEQDALDHIDVEYKGYTFFGKKFRTQSKRTKRRAGLEEETPETIVVIVSLPNDINILGDDLIRDLCEQIKQKYDEKLFEIIQCEIAKEEIIKTPKIKECIEKGMNYKDELHDLVDNRVKSYFENLTTIKDDVKSIKQQKALSFLALKGYDVGQITDETVEEPFSPMKLFDTSKEAEAKLQLKQKLKISDMNLLEDSQEIEILVQNNTDKELNNINVKITHVKEFFEKEIFNQTIDLWFPSEELLFISPVIPHINEYLFFIVEETNGKRKLISRKIDINSINKLES